MLQLRLQNTRRRCRLLPLTGPRPDIHQIDWEAGQGHFAQLAAPVPARDDTRFIGLRNETHFFVCIRVAPKVLSERIESRAVEVSFCPADDRFTRWQYVLNRTGELAEFPYSPGAEVRSSKYRIPSPSHASVDAEKDGALVYTFAFLIADIFPTQAPVGFHVGSSTNLGYSSWTFCSGNGGQDATSFGLLFLAAPGFDATLESAQPLGTGFALSGRTNAPLDVEIVNPLGRKTFFHPVQDTENWSLRVDANTISVSGRYRIRLISAEDSQPICEVPVDLATSRRRSDQFALAITNDPPMSLALGPYSPERLDAEMGLLNTHGVKRMHWIDFDPLIRHWNDPRWISHVDQTLQACDGNLVHAASMAAKRNGLQFIADLKIFDLGANTFWNGSQTESTASELENLPFCVAPEIASNPHLSWQLPPGTNSKAQLPIRQLTIFSEAPLPDMRADDIVIHISQNNRNYLPYRGSLAVRQGKSERSHQTWTPGGLVPEEGRSTNWFLELSNLSIEHPYLSISIAGKPQAVHRAFMLVEAIDSTGKPAPVTLATSEKNGSPLFWKDWLGWNNRIDPLFLKRSWSLSSLTMTFQLAPSMPALLEPADPRSHDIWLSWIDQLLASGVDGVSIRTLCHHTSNESYLKYSWGPAVHSAFRSRHQRRPNLSGADDWEMRVLRTEGYLAFLGKASTRVRAARKIFNLQLESGFELQVEHQARMQFCIPYEEIFRRGLVDEVSFKWFTSENAWLHESVLPKARAHHIATQIVSRNLSPVTAFDLPKTLPLLVENTLSAGFDGYNLYELRDLLDPDITSVRFHPDAGAALTACHYTSM